MILRDRPLRQHRTDDRCSDSRAASTLRHAPSPTRKLAWTWEQAEVPGADGNPWVGINTALPNR